MNKEIGLVQRFKKIASFAAILLMLFSSLAVVGVIVTKTKADAFGPEITDVHHLPRYPVGSTEFNPPNGDKINVYATVTDPDDVFYVNITYHYCNYTMCYPDVTEPMDYMGNDQYNRTLTNGTINGTYLPGWTVHYYITAIDSFGNSTKTPPGINEYYDIELLWLPSSMDVTEELSQQTCYAYDSIRVNGTAIYDNSAPVETSNVTVKIEGEGIWFGKTNDTGYYNMQITAPSTAGEHMVNVTVDNSTRGITGYNETTLTVNPLIITTVTEYLDPAVCYPDEEVWVNGSAVYNSGKPVATSEVNVTIVESGIWWTSATDLNGDYSVNITAPDVIDSYTVNVTINNTTYDLHGYNEKDLTVTDVPIPDLIISEDDITFVSPENPIEGDEIVINAVVHNQGTENVMNALVNFSLDTPTNWFGSDEISVNIGGSDVASATWTSVAGHHTIWVIVDSLNAIAEANEGNNNASKNIFIDKDTDGDGIGDSIDEDDDNDGYNDTVEMNEGTDPLDDSSIPADHDSDFIPDSMDDDDDNDGYNDTVEMNEGTDPLDNSSIPADHDGDFIPDSMDPDIDDDGVLNDDDAFPFDANETVDTDEDGLGDNADEDDDGDGYSDSIDPYLLDSDNDGLSNNIDEDDDNDGILDGDDTYPFDTDNDGSRNDVDEDDDNDGLLDIEEDKNWNGLVDDGETDPLKWDTDEDGINDKNDAFPLDPNRWAEEDYWLWVIFVIIVIILVGGTVLVMWTFKRKVEKEKK